MNTSKSSFKSFNSLLSPASTPNLLKQTRTKVGPSHTVLVEYGEDLVVKVSFPATEKGLLTCQWLVNETIIKIKEDVRRRNTKFDLANFVGLKTKNKISSLDYWLTLPNKSLSVFEEGLILLPVFAVPKKPRELKEANQFTKNDFVYELQIGRGGFADVYLARSLVNGKLYAIKQVKKDLKNKKILNSILRERDILCKLRGLKHVSQIHFAFQDDEYFYMGLEYYPGGNVHFHLRKNRRLEEDEARVIIAETILGLQVLHEHRIIYRDLKPENLMLDSNGHVHITDFGLSKIVADPNELNYSICGTFESIAPEVGEGSGYRFLADYYGIGTLTYELVAGVPPPPFLIRDEEKGLAKNPKYNLKIPKHCSENLRSFIEKLLVEDPASRLGAKGGLAELKEHPWLNSVKFRDIASGTCPPAVEINPLSCCFDAKSLQPRSDANSESPKILPSHRKTLKVIPGFDFCAEQPSSDKPSKKTQTSTTRIYPQKKPPRPKYLNLSAGFEILSTKPETSLLPDKTASKTPKITSQKIFVSFEKSPRPKTAARKSSTNHLSSTTNQLNSSKTENPYKVTSPKAPNRVKKQGIKMASVSTESSSKGWEGLDTARSNLNYKDEMDEKGQVEQALSIKVGIHQMSPTFKYKSREQIENYKKVLKAVLTNTK